MNVSLVSYTIDMIHFANMTVEKANARVDEIFAGFVTDRVRADAKPKESVEAEVREQLARILPQGSITTGHHFVHVLKGQTNERVGAIWFHADSECGQAYLHDIVIFEEHRRKGYARRALEILEQTVAGMGCNRISLNVFGHNPAARFLYESHGYETVAVRMGKTVKKSD